MKNLWLAAILSLPLASVADTSKVNGSITVTTDQPGEDVSTVNGSIRVEDGIKTGDVESVNGSITIGRNAAVEGLDTVNGGIRLGDGASAKAMETVNGSLTLGEGSRVSGDVSAVNGSLVLDRSAEVGGQLSNVNGKMRLDRARVGGGIETTNGDIEVGAGSEVKGGIHVERPSFSWFKSSKRKPRIVIGPDAVVEGTLKFEQEVELYVSDRARIGPVEGATAVKFSGDSPSDQPVER